MDRHGLVEQILNTANGDQRHQIFRRLLIQFASPETGVNECAEANTRKVARFAGCDVAVEMADRTQWQVISLDLVADDELLDRGDEVEMRADDALDETGLRQADDAASLEGVPRPHAEQQGEVARLAEGDRLSVLGRVDIGDGMDDLFGEADAAEAGDGDGVAAVDQAHRFARRDDLVCRPRARGGYHRSRGHENIPQTLAKIPAAPMPVPMHMEIIPYLRLSRCRALISVAVRMAPVAPNGWPSAMAPPSGLTLLGSKPSVRVEARACAANASLSSIQSRSSWLMPASFSAFGIASMGPMPMISAGTPATL